MSNLTQKDLKLQFEHFKSSLNYRVHKGHKLNYNTLIEVEKDLTKLLTPKSHKKRRGSLPRSFLIVLKLLRLYKEEHPSV